MKLLVCLFVCLFVAPQAGRRPFRPYLFKVGRRGKITLPYQQTGWPGRATTYEARSQLGLINLLERTWRTGLHREVHLRASTDAEVRRDEPLRLLHDVSTLVLEFRGCQAPQKTPKNGNAPQKTAMRGTGRRGRLSQDLTFSEFYWARRPTASISETVVGLPSTTRRVDSR